DHARQRLVERFGATDAALAERALRAQLLPIRPPDGVAIGKRSPNAAVLYRFAYAGTVGTAVVGAPSIADTSQPRPAEIWPVVVTVKPSTKGIWKWRRYLERTRRRQWRPYERTWPDWERDAVALMRWIGLSVSQIARVLQRSVKSVERQAPIYQPRWT